MSVIRRLDFNADIGPWAFRRLECRSVADTMALMDEYSIDLAAAGATPGITYRNCHAANEELAADLAATPGASERIIQAAVLNPVYPGCSEDFRRCLDDFGCRVLKLYPNYHGYLCWRSESVELCRMAAERGIPVMIVVRVEDERFHHWQMLIPATPLGDILKLVEVVPEASFVLSGASAPEAGQFLQATAGRDDCMVELSYVKSPFTAVQSIVAAQGSDRLLYGTHLPFVYPAVSTEKIARAAISDAEKAALFSGNACRLLGLAG